MHSRGLSDDEEETDVKNNLEEGSPPLHIRVLSAPEAKQNTHTYTRTAQHGTAQFISLKLMWLLNTKQQYQGFTNNFHRGLYCILLFLSSFIFWLNDESKTNFSNT